MRIMMMTMAAVTNFALPIASTKGRPGFIVETPSSLSLLALIGSLGF